MLTCSATDRLDEDFGGLCGREGGGSDITTYEFNIKDEDTISMDMDGEAEEYTYEIGDGGVMIIEGLSSHVRPLFKYKNGNVVMWTEIEATIEEPSDGSGIGSDLSGTFTVHVIFSKN